MFQAAPIIKLNILYLSIVFLIVKSTVLSSRMKENDNSGDELHYCCLVVDFPYKMPVIYLILSLSDHKYNSY